MIKPFAIVTGASSGIGLELAGICAEDGFDLLVAADRPETQAAADRFRGPGADVTVVETDLATTEGIDRLWAAAASRPVDALLANAGHGLGRGFLDQDFADVGHRPKHSGFFDTTLDTLLETLHIRRVILTGIAGNICVVFTANNAYMREYKIFAPAGDCIVSNTAADNDHALRQIQTVLKGDDAVFTRLEFQANRRRGTARRR